MVSEPSVAVADNGRSRNEELLDIAVAGSAAILFFLLLQASPYIPGGFDGYRHVRQASRLLTDPRGMFADPWRLAFFWPRPVDAWFGYHLLLLPLAAVLPLITAAKVLSSAIFGGIAWVLLRLLRLLQVEYRVTWLVLVLFGTSLTLARATTLRPYLLSVLLTLIAALLTLKQRPFLLVSVSALHALSYSMFFLVAMAPVAWLALRRDRAALKLVIASGAGIAIGLLANPYFPENIVFDFVQATVVDIGLRAHVRMGGELYPVNSVWWLVAALPILAVWVAALVVWARKPWPQPSARQLFLLLSAVACAASLRVNRTVDFFVPFAMLFAAGILQGLVSRLRSDLKRIIAAGVLICLGVNLFLVFRYVRYSPSLDWFRPAAGYLRDHAKGELVANAQWADYQFLFFLNPASRYLVGIEPTFLYIASPRKHWLWQHLSDDETSTCGREICSPSERIDIPQAVRQELGARYIFVEHVINPRLEAVLRTHQDVREVHRDPHFSVFELEGGL